MTGVKFGISFTTSFLNQAGAFVVIYADGTVQLNVIQEVSSATTETAFNAPVISTRSIRTDLLVRDGQTITLGGLTDKQRDVQSAGVPILSSIPLIGGLFGRQARSTTETEHATRLARDAGARTIGITRMGKSPLARYCDIVLHTIANETRYRPEAMSSRVAQLALIDALVSCCALADARRSIAKLELSARIIAGKRF